VRGERREERGEGGGRVIWGFFILFRVFSVFLLFVRPLAHCWLQPGVWYGDTENRGFFFLSHTGAFYDLSDDITSQWLLFLLFVGPRRGGMFRGCRAPGTQA
jgi:hypothetical protein